MKQLTAIFMVTVLVFSGLITAPTILFAQNESSEENSAQPTSEPKENQAESIIELIESIEEPEVRGSEARAQVRVHHEPDDFADSSLYYLVSEAYDAPEGSRYLDGIPLYSDGEDTKLNKADLHLPDSSLTPPRTGYDIGNRMYFRFPRNTAQRFDANYNETFAANNPPFINMTFNTLYMANKEINIEILIDANGDFDPDEYDLSKIEGTITFDKYSTQKPTPSWDVQVEETVEAYGTWNETAPNIPKQIRDGAIYLTLYRTDNIFDPEVPFLPDLLVYCGFTNKTSWIALPYEHKVSLPKVNASYDFIKDQNTQYYGIWEPPSKGMLYDDVPESMKMKPYDTITFNASRSYDLNDDFNGNGKIDDGIPEGEVQMADEVDTLEYKWYFGDGTYTGWQPSPMINHHYVMDASVREKNYTVTVQVRNRQYHVVSDTCWIRIFNEEHPPEILGIDIKPVSIDPHFPDAPAAPRAVVNQKVQFTGSAQDLDPWDINDLRFKWDLNGDSIVDTDVEGRVVETSYSAVGNYKVGLWVYDGDKDNTSTFYDYEEKTFYISENEAPTGMIIAARSGQEPVNTSIVAQLEEAITFNTTMCSDPDLLPGFDISEPEDFVQDHSLSFKWHWNLDRENQLIADGLDPNSYSDVISGWTFNVTTQHKFNYDDVISGNFYKVKVQLEVNDGEEIIKSEIFTVNLNLAPVAGFYINNQTKNMQMDPINIGQQILFDASLSYDPNDDVNGDGVVTANEDNLEYSWYFDDGTSAEGKVVWHAFASSDPPEHTISLTVFDGEMTARETRQILIKDMGTRPIIVLEIPIRSGPTFYQFSFKASDSYDNDRNDDVAKFLWNFGDGQESISADTTHSYTKEGLYKITLTITDRNGLTSMNDNYSIYVYNRRPSVALKMNTLGETNMPIKMTCTATDTDGSIAGFYWEIEDYTEDWSNKSHITYEFKSTGSKTVKVTVKDDKGLTNTTTKKITINPPKGDDDGTGTTDQGAVDADTLFWLIVAIIVIVIVVAITVIVWRIRKEVI